MTSRPDQVNIEEVWKPIPGSSQELALDTRCHHTLYTGARGPGKTDCQLMRFRRRVGAGYGDAWRGVIFDREYKNLSDLIHKSQKWFKRFNDGATFKRSPGELNWSWPTGEVLYFRAVKHKDDYWNYHGHEYPFIGWNELTKYPTSELYDAMMSVNRTSFVPEDHPIYIDSVVWEQYGVQSIVDESHPNAMKIFLPPIPLEVFSTTNPYGAGHIWVKRRFIDPAPFGQVVEKKREVLNPRTKKKEEVVLTQVAIHGSWSENPYLDPVYVANLLEEKDESKRKAWADGSWNIIAGGAISDIWDPNIHILPRFVIPHSWRTDRGFDWGSTHPFSVGWWAEANGEEATIIFDGKAYSFCPPPGSLIRFFEWYGAKDIGTNQGLKMSAKDIAEGIETRESSLMFNKWIHTKPYPGPADNQIRNVTQVDVDTIEKKMADNGVKWTPSDKSPGSRKNGLQLFRDMLQAAVEWSRGESDAPGIWFMINCRASIATLPALPRSEKDPDDVDTEAEDHVYDEVRYRVLAAGAPKLAKNIDFKFAY